jgi:hypothetical protein
MPGSCHCACHGPWPLFSRRGLKGMPLARKRRCWGGFVKCAAGSSTILVGGCECIGEGPVAEQLKQSSVSLIGVQPSRKTFLRFPPPAFASLLRSWNCCLNNPTVWSQHPMVWCRRRSPCPFGTFFFCRSPFIGDRERPTSTVFPNVPSDLRRTNRLSLCGSRLQSSAQATARSPIARPFCWCELIGRAKRRFVPAARS